MFSNQNQTFSVFPLEIYEIILDNIFDVETISNCRKTCTFFNEILTRRCIKITENKKRDYNNPFPRLSRNKNLILNFLYSFQNIRCLDFPIFVNHSIFQKVSKLNLERLTIRTEDITEILYCIDIFIRQGKTLKIIKDKNIYWLKENFFGKFNGNYDFNDELLMDICRYWILENKVKSKKQ